MKISYKWLCQILPGLEKHAPQDVANKLTFSGLEVEEVLDQKQKYQGIVVGEVLEKGKHPNADKLSLCKVSSGNETFAVVCGAPNVTAGKKYPFATLGTVMPYGLKIKPIKLRGVESSGMLCSAKELEISEEGEGIYELPDVVKTGEAISEALHLNDVVFTLGITPNRGDALSHYGVAQDLAALYSLEINKNAVLPDQKLPASSSASNNIKIDHKDQKGCLRFTASQIHGVSIKASPLWLASRLESLGIRSINNVVDATNYVMLLTGHPVHAYDARQVKDHKIIIEALQDKAAFNTLDGIERQLAVGDVVIADGSGPVGLAGIMGGENSEIQDDTADLVLEVACFDATTTRKTSKRLGLQSESSYRFERGVNPNTVLEAHEVLRDLIVSLAGGEGSPIADSYPSLIAPKTIQYPKNLTERLLGIALSDQEVTKSLTAIGCKVKEQGESLEVTVPTSRSDLYRAVDLVEEVARIIGLEHIPTVAPRLCLRKPAQSALSHLNKELKQHFLSQGFYETVHYSFGEQKFFEKVLRPKSTEGWASLQNPLSEDLAIMRPSLLPHLLQTYIKNHNATDKGLRFFELRSVYKQDQDPLKTQKPVLAGIYSGALYGRNRFSIERKPDTFDGKGLLISLFERLRVKTKEQRQEAWPFHPTQSLEFLTSQKEVLASVGSLHPELLQELKIKEALHYFEIDCDVLLAHAYKKPLQYQGIPKLPPVYRDLALLAPRDLSYQDILKAIDQAKPPFLKTVELFDVYEGPNVQEGKKSLAFSLIYEPNTESLTDEKVNEMHFKMVNDVCEKLRIELR